MIFLPTCGTIQNRLSNTSEYLYIVNMLFGLVANRPVIYLTCLNAIAVLCDVMHLINCVSILFILSLQLYSGVAQLFKLWLLVIQHCQNIWVYFITFWDMEISETRWLVALLRDECLTWMFSLDRLKFYRRHWTPRAKGGSRLKQCVQYLCIELSRYLPVGYAVYIVVMELVSSDMKAINAMVIDDDGQNVKR